MNPFSATSSDVPAGYDDAASTPIPKKIIERLLWVFSAASSSVVGGLTFILRWATERPAARSMDRFTASWAGLENLAEPAAL